MTNSKPKFLRLKKVLSFFLFSNLIGYLLRIIYKNKIPLYESLIYTEGSIFSNVSIAKIYFKSYEGAELRFVNKYLFDSSNIIELGSSLGVVSSVLAKKLLFTNFKLICVEGNPNLIPILERNVNSNRYSEHNHIHNLVIDYSANDSFTRFDVSTKILNSKKGTQNVFKFDHDQICIENTTLTKLINYHRISDFILVCDIEGAEIELFLNDFEALQKCSYIFIELHEICYNQINYSVFDIVQLIIEQHCFNLVDSYDCVYVFKK